MYTVPMYGKITLSLSICTMHLHGKLSFWGKYVIKKLMNHPLLMENEAKRLNIRLPLLICFAMFAAWQTGVVFYSGTAFLVNGTTPIPVDVGNLSILYLAGVIFAIIFHLFFQQYTVWAVRITAIFVSVCSVIFFLPVPEKVFSAAYLATCFLCVIMAGFECAIVVNIFTLKTGLKFVLCAYAASFILTGILQNDSFPISFSVFRIFIPISLSFMIFFFFKLPSNPEKWIRYH